MAPVRKRRAKSRGLNDMGFPSVAATRERIAAVCSVGRIAERREFWRYGFALGKRGGVR
ncbi:hypothetical protein D3C79_988890 [compost metagenome]